MKPRGHLTVALEKEWRAALSRKAAAKVREAEGATVRGALLTFSELQVHMANRGRPFPPDSVDLDAFLFEGTEAQSRALAGLKWLAKAGQLDYDLSAYDFRGQPQREARQAAVAEPPMLALLERADRAALQLQEPTVEGYAGPLGVWLWCAVSRASPRRLSRSTFHFHCGRGKQKGNRHGFDFAIPRHLMSGWDWASRWLEDWQDLPASKRATSGAELLRARRAVHHATDGAHRPGPLHPAAWWVGGCPDLLLLPGVLGLPMLRWPDGHRRTSWPWATGRTRRGQRSRATPCH